MCSTRNALRLPLFAILALSLTGCGFQQARTRVKPDPLNDSPLVVDEAMQKRDWERTSAYYAPPVVVAGPTWLTFRGDEKAERTDLITDPFIFGVNVLASPYAAVRDPQWEAVEHRGATVPPTHHAMPPLPE